MLRAFHNDPAIKDFYLARVRAHREADQIRHGYYWEQGKGCAVGCTLHSANHHDYETELGIPRVLARLEDGIFEALNPPEDVNWPERFLDAIPVGADLSMVWPQFALAMLTDPGHGILRHVMHDRHARQRAAIATVIAHFCQWVTTGFMPAAASAAYAAAYAADVAAYAAAYAAADTADAAAYAASTTATAAAASAAYAAAYAADVAAYAAADTADAAAAAYAADAAADAAYAADSADTAAYVAAAAAAYAVDAAADAKQQARQWQAATLLDLLRHAPQPVV